MFWRVILIFLHLAGTSKKRKKSASKSNESDKKKKKAKVVVTRDDDDEDEPLTQHQPESQRGREIVLMSKASAEKNGRESLNKKKGMLF